MGNDTGKYSVKHLLNRVINATEDGLNIDAEIGDIDVDLSSTAGGFYVGKPSGTNGDFTTTYTSATTITLSGFPSQFSDINDEDIVTLVQIATDGSVTKTYTRDNATMSTTSNVLTVTGATFTNTDTFVLYTNIPRVEAYDTSLDSKKTIVQNPAWARYTDKEALFSTAYELTASFADVGNEIDVRGYNYLTLWVTIDIGTSVNPQLRILHKHTSAGAEEYREIYLGSPTSNKTTINLNDYEVGADSDQLFKITLPVTGTAFVQIQAKDDANGDGQIDALYVTKAWGA